MKKNKLFYMMNALSNKEMRRFKKMVSNQGNPSMEKLVNFLETNLRKTEVSAYPQLRDKAMRHISKSVPTDQNKRRILSALTQILCTFMIRQELNEQEFVRESLLQKQYLKRGLTDLYEQSIETNQILLSTNAVRDFHYHRSLVQISHNAYYHVTHKYNEKDILEGLRNIHNHLDLSYVLAKLHYTCEVKMVQLIRGETFQIELLDEVLHSVKDHPHFSHPVIGFYVDVLALIHEPNFEEYQRLKKEWVKLGPMFSEEVQHQLFITMLNLSWFSCTENRSIEMYELYKYGLTTRVLIIREKIDSSHFNNIVDLGSSLGAFDEVRSFIRQFAPFLDINNDKMENVKTLYEAFLLFGEKKFDESLRQSIFLEFNDVSYGLRAYLLMLKCLYESLKTKGFKEINHRCEAFKQYLQRKFKQGMINKQTRQENLNFIKIIKHLPLASASRFANISQQDLHKKLKAMPHVVSRAWLSQKLNELK